MVTWGLLRDLGLQVRVPRDLHTDTTRGTPPRKDTIMDDITLFLDHWLITRRDGDTILNGTPEEFERSMRDLVRTQCIQALSAADDAMKWGRIPE